MYAHANISAVKVERPRPKIGFFHLPPEIRNMIYIALLQPEHRPGFNSSQKRLCESCHEFHRIARERDKSLRNSLPIWCGHSKRSFRGSTRILQLCRQTYAEAYLTFSRMPLLLEFFVDRYTFGDLNLKSESLYRKLVTSNERTYKQNFHQYESPWENAGLRKNRCLVERLLNLSILLNCVSAHDQTFHLSD